MGWLLSFLTQKICCSRADLTFVSRRGSFLFSQAVIPLLIAQAEASPEYPPTLIFTGATAALKASARGATFAAGKFALRAIAQSLAREFGPQGIHVAHAIIDGVIDIEKSKGYDLGHPEAKISPEAVSQFSWIQGLGIALTLMRLRTHTGTYTRSQEPVSPTSSISDRQSRSGKILAEMALPFQYIYIETVTYSTLPGSVQSCFLSFLHASPATTWKSPSSCW